jgi:hypothetical protein
MKLKMWTQKRGKRRPKWTKINGIRRTREKKTHNIGANLGLFRNSNICVDDETEVFISISRQIKL